MFKLLLIISLYGGQATLAQHFETKAECVEELTEWIHVVNDSDYDLVLARCDYE